MTPWIGVREVQAAFEKVSAQADLASREVLAKSSAVVVAAAQGNFQGAHKRGKPHVGGAAPNVVSGDLRRSIRMEPILRTGFASYMTSVGPHVIYGRRVELGYIGSGKGRGHQTTRAFPYFDPAIEATRAPIEALSVATYRKYLF
jgi:hypothetical protein